jgi:hypothetical protein
MLPLHKFHMQLSRSTERDVSYTVFSSGPFSELVANVNEQLALEFAERDEVALSIHRVFCAPTYDQSVTDAGGD